MLKAQATEDREPVIEVDTGKLSLYALEEAKTTKRGQQAGDSPPGEAEDAEASRVTEIPKTQVPEDQQPDNDVENEEISLYALEGAETIKSEQQAGDSSPQEAEDAEALREGQERAQAAAMEEEETRWELCFMPKLCLKQVRLSTRRHTRCPRWAFSSVVFVRASSSTFVFCSAFFFIDKLS